MTQHDPKTGALLAYDGGLLSEAGRARLEKHLARCAVCRRELASIKAYEAALGEARDATYREPDFARMELALARVAKEQASAIQAQNAKATDKRGESSASAAGISASSIDSFSSLGRRPSKLPWLVLAAAAALAVAWFAQRSAPTTEQRAPEVADRVPAAPNNDPVAPPSRSASRARVTAVAGDAMAESPARDRQTLALGNELLEGTRLRTGEGGRLDLRLDVGTGAVLGASTSTLLAELRDGQTAIELESGVVSNRVRHLDLPAGDRYEVRAGDYVVRVRGTRFAVARQGGDVVVTVDEGVVEVSRVGQVVTTIRAPGIWRSSDAASFGVDQGGVPLARAVDADAVSWPAVALPVVPGLRSWRIDDQVFSATTSVSLRAPIGPLALTALDERGRELHATLEVTASGAELPVDAIRPSAPAVRQGHLAAALIQPVVQGGLRALGQCYRLALARQPTIEGTVQLRITVGMTGDVQRVVVKGTDGAPPPADLAACIDRNASNWTFPPPTGGPVTVDLPINLRAR